MHFLSHVSGQSSHTLVHVPPRVDRARYTSNETFVLEVRPTKRTISRENLLRLASTCRGRVAERRPYQAQKLFVLKRLD